MRPKVTINCAMSADGKLALVTRKQTRISSDEDIARVHRLRNECDAILVGIGTIFSDDPKLTVKEKYLGGAKARNPMRIVLDEKCRTPRNALVLNRDARTIIFIGKEAHFPFSLPSNVETIKCDSHDGILALDCVMSKLHEAGVRRLLVEGGSSVIYSFLRARIVDELFIYIGSMIIGGDAPSLACGSGAKTIDEIIKLRLLSAERVGEGLLVKYIPENVEND